MANQSLDSTSYGIFILICTFDYILAHYACVIGRVCDCIVLYCIQARVSVSTLCPLTDGYQSNVVVVILLYARAEVIKRGVPSLHTY